MIIDIQRNGGQAHINKGLHEKAVTDNMSSHRTLGIGARHQHPGGKGNGDAAQHV